MGIFDNAKTVMINNKEVQSIITSNGGIIYKNWKLDLTSDKQIIQTGEVATLSATLTHGGTGVSGKTIFFYEADSTPIICYNTGYNTINENVGTSFKIYYSPKNNDSQSYLVLTNSNNSLAIYWHANGRVSISRVGELPTEFNTTSNFLELENGVLSDGDGHSYDLSSYGTNMTIAGMWYEGIVFYDNSIIGIGTTNSSGVASVSYTGKATGLLNIRASTSSGIIQSEIYEVQDCWLYTTQEYSQAPTSSDWSDIVSGFSFENTGEWEVSYDLKVTANSTRVEINGVPLPTSSNSANWGVGINGSGLLRNFIEKNGTSYDTGNYGSFSKNTYHSVKQVMSDGKLSAYFDSELLKTINDPFFSDYQTLYFIWRNWGNSATTYVKNIKIKPL